MNIKKVGVKNIAYPIAVRDKAIKIQKTVATVNMYVNLPHHFKGTHMSRFVEILNRFHGEITMKSFHLILHEMKNKLQAEAAHLEIEFPYFLKKKSSATSVGIVEYKCKMHGSLSTSDDLILEIQVPISPPSLNLGGQGLPKSLGHWGVAVVSLRFRHFIWLEDIIDMVETITYHDCDWAQDQNGQAADSLTVESLTKALGKKLQSNADLSWFTVTVKNFLEGCSIFASLDSGDED
jgi:GTP cyclohydrolase I